MSGFSSILAGLGEGILAGQEKQRLLARQAKLDAQNSEKQDFTQDFALRNAGYRPQAAAQQSADQDVSTAMNVPLPLAIDNPDGSIQFNRGPLQATADALAKSRNVGQDVFQAPTSKGPQPYVFDYEHSPAGIMQARQTATEQAKQTAEQNRQGALATAANALKQGQRAAVVRNRIASLKQNPDYQGWNDQQLQGIAEDDNAFANAVKPVQAKAPLVGSPDWVAAEEKKAQIAAKYREPSAPLAVESTAPDGTKTTRYVTRQQALQEGNAPIAKGAGAGGQTRLPERTQQLGLALQNAGAVLPLHESMTGANAPSLGAGLEGAAVQEGGKLGQAANWLMNKTGNDSYLNYVNGMNGLLLAVAHSVGGARISKEQVHLFGGNMMLGAGDGPTQNAQKLNSIIGFMNSARSTLPPEAVAQQEAQLNPATLKYLQSKGYGGAPTAEGLAAVAKVKELGGVKEDAGSGPSTDKVITATAWNGLSPKERADALAAGYVRQP